MNLKKHFTKRKSMSCSSTFTVLFEKPFWVGIYERNRDDKYEVAKINFGTKEPTNNEIFNFLLTNYDLFVFSTPTTSPIKTKKHSNPKKMQRDIKKQLGKTTIGTKAQIELKKQFEKNKRERKYSSKKNKTIQSRAKFKLKKQKRKSKHKGR